MRIHHRVLYLPINGNIEGERTQKWWDAWNLTSAVKDGTLNGYVNIRLSENNRIVRIDRNNAHIARQRYGRYMLATAQAEAGDEYTLVPVSSKDAVVNSRGPYRSMSLMTAALGDQIGKVSDVIRYTEALQKASQGGPRFAHEIYPKMKIDGCLPDKPVVLVDDVMTSGGHMKAARKRLEEAGCDVKCGIVFGRTVYSTNLDPLAAGVIEIDDSIDPFEEIDF